MNVAVKLSICVTNLLMIVHLKKNHTFSSSFVKLNTHWDPRWIEQS